MYLAEGHRLIIVDNLSTGKRENVPAGAEFVELDITDPSLEGVFARFRPEIVCHHAAQMDLRRSMEEPLFDSTVNYLGTLNLLECCRRHPIRQFIFASSGGAIYGDGAPLPTPEEAVARPLSVYGANKLAGETIIGVYARLLGFTPTLLRYANVYGPRQNAHGEAGVIAIFLDKLRAGVTPVIHGTGEKVRDYVFVGDIVAVNRFAVAGSPAGAFNVGTGVGTSVNALACHLLTALGLECAIPHGPDKAGEQCFSVLDASRIREAMGGYAFMPLAEGLARTVTALP